MYKKYWKELIIVGFAVCSFVGLVLILIFNTKWWLRLLNKIQSGGEEPKQIPALFEGKETFFKDENGNMQPIMKMEKRKYQLDFDNFMMLCSLGSIAIILLVLFNSFNYLP